MRRLCATLRFMVSRYISKLHAAVYEPLLYRRRVNALVREISPRLPERGTVLDLGIGSGRLIEAIAADRPGLTWSGLDVKRHPECAFPVTLYDGHELPLATDSVDWVTAIDVLHHAVSPVALLAECARVARHGVVLKDHTANTRLSFAVLSALDWAGNRAYGVETPFNFLSEREWRCSFERLGLRVDAYVNRLGIYPWPIRIPFPDLHFIVTLRSSEND